jgi:hypothetical protein
MSCDVSRKDIAGRYSLTRGLLQTGDHCNRICGLFRVNNSRLSFSEIGSGLSRLSRWRDFVDRHGSISLSVDGLHWNSFFGSNFRSRSDCLFCSDGRWCDYLVDSWWWGFRSIVGNMRPTPIAPIVVFIFLRVIVILIAMRPCRSIPIHILDNLILVLAPLAIRTLIINISLSPLIILDARGRSGDVDLVDGGFQIQFSSAFSLSVSDFQEVRGMPGEGPDELFVNLVGFQPVSHAFPAVRVAAWLNGDGLTQLLSAV